MLSYPKPPTGLHALVARAARGDLDAVPEFALLAAIPLFAFARRLGCSKASAEDATHEVILALVRECDALARCTNTPGRDADRRVWCRAVRMLLVEIRKRRG